MFLLKMKNPLYNMMKNKETSGFSEISSDEKESLTSNIHSSYICMQSDDSSLMEIDLSECTRNRIDANKDIAMDDQSFLIISHSDVPRIDPLKEKLTYFSDICQKAWSNMTNRFYSRKESVDSEIPAKRMKQHRKANAIAMGRGRGRAKYQLRRSGVSQARHRKQRIKPGFALNIQDVYRSWQNTEIHPLVQNDHSLDSESDILDSYDVPDAVQFNQTTEYNMDSEEIMVQNKKTFEDPTYLYQSSWITTSVTPTERKSCEMQKITDYTIPSRQRLLSESTVDSEDGFCIVFESDLEENNETDDVDYNKMNSYESSEDTSDSEDETINEIGSDNEELTAQKKKVSFDPSPVVHIMVKWDYAYRAARKGPWEEIARDTERFKYRINSIAHVLNPILTNKHRAQVWQERFALQEYVPPS